MKRLVIVGASSRALYLFVELLYKGNPDDVEITGIYDINKTRCKVFRDEIGDACKIYDGFDEMLDAEKPDYVVVATVDSVHHEYIIRALEKGYNVISEKPITNTYERCKEIRAAEKRSGKSVKVTFNCRYMSYFEEIKKLLQANRIGKVLSINYEYCLDRDHGGDYFKRWHKRMEFSQGMLLHKATHHFDIINWFLEDEPHKVTALGNQVYYNNKDKCMADRCRNCEARSACESSQLLGEENIQRMYYDAEHEDGYIRDRCSFAGEADICDNMSISVLYGKGAILTYTLNLFSRREGYRLSIQGERGSLIHENWYGDSDPNLRITLISENGDAEDIIFPKDSGSHGGGDAKMLAALFNSEEDGLSQHATAFDGITSAIIGIAGNMSIREERTVNVKALIDDLR